MLARGKAKYCHWPRRADSYRSSRCHDDDDAMAMLMPSFSTLYRQCSRVISASFWLPQAAFYFRPYIPARRAGRAAFATDFRAEPLLMPFER